MNRAEWEMLRAKAAAAGNMLEETITISNNKKAKPSETGEGKGMKD